MCLQLHVSDSSLLFCIICFSLFWLRVFTPPTPIQRIYDVVHFIAARPLQWFPSHRIIKTDASDTLLLNVHASQHFLPLHVVAKALVADAVTHVALATVALHVIASVADDNVFTDETPLQLWDFDAFGAIVVWYFMLAPCRSSLFSASSDSSCLR